MQIDWFTLVAQVVNFLILVWLLKRFLYGPILRAMEERQRHIAQQAEDARQTREEAEKQRREYEKQREDLERRRSALLDEAARDADERRKQLLQRAREEVAQLQRRWRETVAREKSALLAEFRRRAGHEVCAIATRVMRDLADQRLEHHMVNVFMARLDDIAPEDRRALADAARESGNRITVRSAFAIPPERREQISRDLQRRLSDDAQVAFEVDEDLICGIELRSNGLKAGWTVAGYLESLDEGLAQALAREEAGAS